MTAAGRAVCAAGVGLWIVTMGALLVGGFLGWPDCWGLLAAAGGSAMVGYAACGLLNHSP